jgi:hypothetical protein
MSTSRPPVTISKATLHHRNRHSLLPLQNHHTLQELLADTPSTQSIPIFQNPNEPPPPDPDATLTLYNFLRNQHSTNSSSYGGDRDQDQCGSGKTPALSMNSSSLSTIREMTVPIPPPMYITPLIPSLKGPFGYERVKIPCSPLTSQLFSSQHVSKLQYRQVDQSIEHEEAYDVAEERLVVRRSSDEDRNGYMSLCKTCLAEYRVTTDRYCCVSVLEMSRDVLECFTWHAGLMCESTN